MQDAAIQPDRGQRSGAASDPRLDWWRAAKFGLFIHWGLYAISAGRWKGRDVDGIGEWIMRFARIPIAEYEPLAHEFNPHEFDAKAWISIAKAAGQKYVVITSKHHDGFCLFDSKYTEYSVAKSSPFARDVIQELADECQRQDMALGFYYSQTQDWHHPNGDGNDWDFDPTQKDFDSYIETYVTPQVTELLTQYGPVALIWFDTPKGITQGISQQQSQKLLDLCHRLQPDTLVCGRLGNALGDYATTNDNTIPDGALLAGDWETPATMNDTWGYKSQDDNWKSPTELIQKLVDIVSKGGNYLLNVGPTASGAMPPESIERLEAMGDWLSVYGEAVYGVGPGPIQDQPAYRTTSNDLAVFVLLFDWPSGGKIQIPGVRANKARILGSSSTEVSLKVEDGLLSLGLPPVAPNQHCSVIELT